MIRNTLSILAYLLCFGSLDALSQNSSSARIDGQEYLSDSSTVYWTQYPDPFSLPAYTDRKPLSPALSIHCELSGCLEVAFVSPRTDSIIHRFAAPKHKKVHYSFRVWQASPSVDTSTVPEDRFRNNSSDALDMVLMVDAKRKTILHAWFTIPLGSQCYLKWY